MKPKTLITLSVAVGCGLVAALMMKQAGNTGPVIEEPRVTVATVVEQINTGQRINPNHVKFKEIPQSLVPENAITSADQYQDRAVISPAYPGELLTMDRLGAKGIYGESITIEPGYRVIGVPVDASNSFSGMLQPGDRVDILVTYRVEYQLPTREKVERTKTATLLEYVKVFATDNRTVERGGDQYTAESTAQVHLLLTPEQATWIKLAQEKGRLSLAWRSELDTDLADVATIEDGLLVELNGAVGGVGDVPRYEDENDFNEDEEAEDLLATEIDDEEESLEFAEFLAAANTSFGAAEEPVLPDVWTMEVFNGRDTELIDVPLPVREAPTAEEAEASATDATEQPSAIGTSASVLRQFLLGF